jgi:type IV secretory pathway VirB2 component (pilin)
MVVAVALLVVLATSAFAVEAGDYDWASDITDNIAGFTAGVVASIAAVFAIAVMVRLTFRAARITLKALGFIK